MTEEYRDFSASSALHTYHEGMSDSGHEGGDK